MPRGSIACFGRLAAVPSRSRARARDRGRATTSSHSSRARACLERGEFVAVLADRIAAEWRTRVVEVDFLGGRAAFPPGPFVLASRLDCPILLMVACVGRARLRDRRGAPRGSHPAAARRSAGAPARPLQAYATRLEAYSLRRRTSGSTSTTSPRTDSEIERVFEFPPLADLVSHGRPMLLLGRVLAHDEERPPARSRSRGRAVPRARWLRAGLVRLEYMAQCIAVHAALVLRAEGQLPPPRGFLVGARGCASTSSASTPRSVLEAIADARLGGKPEPVSFECALRDATGGKVLAEGRLKFALRRCLLARVSTRT